MRSQEMLRFDIHDTELTLYVGMSCSVFATGKAL